MHPMSPLSLEQSTWLLTGANGNIGRVLRAHLRAVVGQLRVADLSEPDDPAANETAIAFDLTDPNTMVELVRGCDGVVHLAGIPDEAPYDELMRVNALGTHNLLEAMRGAGVRRMVYASSNRVTGMYGSDQVLDDQSPVRPDGLYGASKAAVEALLRLYGDKFDLQVSCLRIGSFEERPTSPREAATWLSHADAMRAFEAAMTTNEKWSVFYAVSANRRRFWSLEPGRAVGFEPQDDASSLLGQDVVPPPGPQAGDMASPEFTIALGRLR